MREKLTELKQELQKGEQEMARLERQRQLLRDTMLRISGAIQVLEELQTKSAPADHDNPVSFAAA